jgi:ABC transporter substrate binding protein
MGWPLWSSHPRGSPASLGFSRRFSPSWRDAGAGIPARFCNNGAGEGAGPVCLRDYAQRRLIVELAGSSRLPTIYSYREFVELGGLMACAYDIGELWRQLANYTDLVLKGTKPGELPIYQATKYNSIVNLKTAKGLGLEIPQRCLPEQTR